MKASGWHHRHSIFGLGLGLVLVGLSACQTSSTLEDRRHERYMAYATLSAEQRELVDRGQIRVGMPMDAVYIAWGKPTEETQAEDAGGLRTIWRYHGAYARETRYWTYREVSRDGSTYLERYLDRDYDPRNYVRAEIVFLKGRIQSWRTLPQPNP